MRNVIVALAVLVCALYIEEIIQSKINDHIVKIP